MWQLHLSRVYDSYCFTSCTDERVCLFCFVLFFKVRPSLFPSNIPESTVFILVLYLHDMDIWYLMTSSFLCINDKGGPPHVCALPDRYCLSSVRAWSFCYCL